MALAGEMLALGGLAPTSPRAARRPRPRWPTAAPPRCSPAWSRRWAGPTISSSTARAICAHAPVIRPCNGRAPGHVAGMDAREIGIAVVALGGGRAHADDAIDPSVGLTE